jgi:outer membrane protein OmpA-like peptidoglycan-associated protein
LSDRRAKTVKEYLIKNYDISSERLKAYGVGHSQHKFKDDPDNAGNRRVEVKYTKQ